MSIDLFNASTPTTTSSEYTTPSSTLNSADIQARAALGSGYDWKTRAEVEEIIAVVVVNGMSRIGYSDQLVGVDWQHQLWMDAVTPYASVSPSAMNIFFGKPKANVINPPEVTPADNSTELSWKIEVSGWDYQSQSISARLALVVLFVDGFIITYHLIYLLYLGVKHHEVVNMSWGSFDDIVALSRISGDPGSVPEALRNTSSGVQSHKTLRRLVKIRRGGEESISQMLGEELQIIIEGEDESLYDKVQRNRSYGSAV